MRTAQRYTLIGLLVVTVLLLVFEETHLGKGYFYLANYYDQEVLREITVVREKPQKIGIAIVLESVKDEEKYEMALDTVRCYARHFGYGLHVIHARNETEISKKCPQKDFMFRRHCVLSLKMASIRDDWLLFLDGDMGVINPNRLIEEFLPEQDTTQLVFYSRIMNHEVMAGSYLTKNSRWAREFLMFWAEYERKLPDSFHGSDNGAIHNVILEKALPLLKDQTEICDDNYWKTAKDYDGLSTFVVCARQLLKANQTPEIEILEKGRFAWARDGWLTRSIWSDRDFILHGWQKRCHKTSICISIELPAFNFQTPKQIHVCQMVFPHHLRTSIQFEHLFRQKRLFELEIQEHFYGECRRRGPRNAPHYCYTKAGLRCTVESYISK